VDPFLPPGPLRVVEEPLPAPKRVVEPRKPQPRRWWEILAVLCVAVLPDVVHAVEVVLLDWPEVSSAAQSIGLLIRSLFVSYVVLFVARAVQMPRADLGLTRPRWSDAAIGGVLCLIGVGMSMWLGSLVPGRPPSEFFMDPETPTECVLLVVALAANAFAEELVVRGYLIPRLEDATASLPFAIVASAGLFASYHLYQGLGGMLLIFVTGLIYGVGFVLVRRLWPFVVAHFLWGVAASFPIGAS